MEDRRPYKPPLRGSIRERALASVTRRASDEEVLTRAELLQASERDLSPVYINALQERLDLFEDFAPKSSNFINEIRRQNSVADADEQERALLPARDLGFSAARSTRDRNAAILGILERERRRNAPLSRAALERAKALAASRRRFRQSRGLPLDYDYTSLTPCIEADERERVRRQVMFARGSAGVGYRGAGRRKVRC